MVGFWSSGGGGATEDSKGVASVLGRTVEGKFDCLVDH